MSAINGFFARLCDALKQAFFSLKRTFVSKSFLLFCALGIVNCIDDSLFSWLARLLGLQENLAAVVGYAISLTIAFLLTCKFIFKKPPSFTRYIKFLISYIPNFIIFFLVTFITINTWGLHQFVGTFLAAAAGGPITFVIIKLYAFGTKNAKKRQ